MSELQANATKAKKLTSLSSELNNSISHLGNLLKYLPTTLPLAEPPTFDFTLNNDYIKDEGLVYALNQCLEVAFKTHVFVNEAPFKLLERRNNWTGLCSLLRTTAKELPVAERSFAISRWVEKLSQAACAAEAKIPNRKRAISPASSPSASSQAKRRCVNTINLTSDDENAPTGLPRQTSIVDFAKRVSASDVKATQKALNEKYRENEQALLDKEERTKNEKKLKEQENNRIRQQRHRDKKKMLGGKSAEHRGSASGLNIEKGGCSFDNGAVISQPQPDMQLRAQATKMSHSEHGGWKLVRNGKRGGVAQKEHQRTNYYHPLLWPLINKAALGAAWSPALIVTTLKALHPDLFSRLHRGTISKWISKNDRRRWSTATLNNVKRRSALAGSGRVGILAKHGAIVEEVRGKLLGLRRTGVSVNRLLVRSLFLAVIQQREPELLRSFKCSEHFVGQFLESVMNWTLRQGTRAAAHIPADASVVCERAFFRLVHLVSFYDIPPELVINMDQTGIILMMTKNKTYAEKGTKQVDLVGRDEKRAYTLCVATTPAGNILPFQQVWSGKTSASLPTKDCAGMQSAKGFGFDFVVADSKKASSHFSTLKTMKEWMTNILRPYVASVIAEKDLPPDQKAVLFLDCYPVHIGEEFRVFVLEEYPNVFLIFVPANCTGIFQPADVGVQRILKHFLRQKALDFLVRSHQEQLSSGLTPDQVKFTTSLPVLRNASVQPVLDLYLFLSGPTGIDIIKRAWQKCAVKEWTLGRECIWDPKSRVAFRRYLKEDQILRDEISAKVSAESLAFAVATGVEDDVDEEDLSEDASEIPLSHVVQETLQIAQNLETNRFCVASAAVHDIEGVLAPSADEENIWAYHPDGTPVRSTLISEDGEDGEDSEDGNNGEDDNESPV